MPRLLTAEAEATRRAILAKVPEATGVYIFYDRYDQPTYVGKSVNLRRRMASYFQAAGPTEPRVRSLRFGAHRFDYRVVATELLALLLEDTLIKQLNPDHNKAQRRLEEFRYLELSAGDDAASLRVVATPSADARSFGPFRNHFFAEELADVTRRWVLQEGSTAAARFLDGDAGRFRAAVESEMSRHVHEQRFERAAELRDLIKRFERFCARQRFTRRFATDAVEVLHADGVTYAFEAGALVRAEGSELLEVPVELVEAPSDPRALVDRAAIVEAAARSAEAG